jgi:hypothetical protein
MTAASRDFASYREFWKFYLEQHRNPVCRQLHFVGTTLVLACLAAACLVSPLFALAAPIVGYGFAWTGHFVFEKNRPATFGHPIWSLVADFEMYFRMLLGRELA